MMRFIFPCFAMLATVLGTTAVAQPPEGAAVTGLGGFFFRAEDPQALATWYDKSFGITPVPESYDVRPWHQERGPTVFAPFAADTAYLGDPEKSFMLNLRTNDLDALVAHLRDNGTEVALDEKVYPNGRFARLTDPEGNPIQLWEPSSTPN